MHDINVHGFTPTSKYLQYLTLISLLKVMIMIASERRLAIRLLDVMDGRAMHMDSQRILTSLGSNCQVSPAASLQEFLLALAACW